MHRKSLLQLDTFDSRIKEEHDDDFGGCQLKLRRRI